MSMPAIQKMMEGRVGRMKFFKHLISHFHRVLSVNHFNPPLQVHHRQAAVLNRTINYDTISFCNHSCVPNVSTRMVGHIMIGKNIRRIAQDEEITISYINVFYVDHNNYVRYRNTNGRRSLLRAGWNFTCNCILCEMVDQWQNIRWQVLATYTTNRLVVELRNMTENDLRNNFENCLKVLWYLFLNYELNHERLPQEYHLP